MSEPESPVKYAVPEKCDKCPTNLDQENEQPFFTRHGTQFWLCKECHRGAVALDRKHELEMLKYCTKRLTRTA